MSRLQKRSGTVPSRRPNTFGLIDWERRTTAALLPSATTRHALGTQRSTRFEPVSLGRHWPAPCSVSHRTTGGATRSPRGDSEPAQSKTAYAVSVHQYVLSSRERAGAVAVYLRDSCGRRRGSAGLDRLLRR